MSAIGEARRVSEFEELIFDEDELDVNSRVIPSRKKTFAWRITAGLAIAALVAVASQATLSQGGPGSTKTLLKPGDTVRQFQQDLAVAKVLQDGVKEYSANRTLQDGPPPYTADEGTLARMRVLCVIDVSQASVFLGLASTYIAVAVDACPTGNQACAVPTEAIITMFLWSAVFLELAASSCGDTASSDALCAAGITAVTASMAQIATTVTSAVTSCKRESEKMGYGQLLDSVAGRRLMGKAKLPLPPSPAEKAAAQKAQDISYTLCSFDIVEGTAFLMRLGLAIDAATVGCADPTACTINVFNVVAMFSFAAQFWSMVAIHCTLDANTDAACAADISGCIGGVTEAVAGAGTADAACPGNDQDVEKEVEEELA
jgi:hypothetical protein